MDERDCLGVQPDHLYTLHRVWLTPEEEQGFRYLGHACEPTAMRRFLGIDSNRRYPVGVVLGDFGTEGRRGEVVRGDAIGSYLALSVWPFDAGPTEAVPAAFRVTPDH